MTTNVMYGKNIVGDIENALSLCAMVVTDENVARLYPELSKNAFIIPAGEKSKNQQTLFSILETMGARGLKRTDKIAALGGGVVGDVVGLAASLYMRGIAWVVIPTTLLAMVDSCIGGKTAIDYGGVKNLIGTFHAPESVIISYHFLETLYEEDWLCGYGEMIKTCLLTEKSYSMLIDNLDNIIAYDRDAVYALIEKCIEIKQAVVDADPKENGLRKNLNIGHTVGHALEAADGYKSTHGEYVLKGIMTECAMCKDIIDKDFYNQIISICKRFVTPPRTSTKSVKERALHDKKNEGDMITIMLPTAAGEVSNVRIAQSDFIERYDGAIKELKKV
ncbi:MAG: 3-dehydroquinate synthase [Clostridiales bacterium]|nr:3-dehydroquinate synthase [Clostridiales bacterium]